MSVLDLLWIVLIVALLQPVLRQRIVEYQRRRLLARIERRHGSRLILMVHRQETMSLLGIPLLRYIDINDSEQVMQAIYMTDRGVPLELVLHTPGGLSLAALQIAKALARHEAEVTVYVPYYAMSGGTLIAMAADRIVMSPHAVLGPVDPQLGRFPAASLVSVTQQKPRAEMDDQTLVLVDQAEKALSQMHRDVRALLAGRLGEERAEEVARLMSEGHWTHDHPIDYEEAQRIGLPVSDAMPEPVLELMRLYPQPMRRMPTVEFSPEPHHGGGRRG